MLFYILISFLIISGVLLKPTVNQYTVDCSDRNSTNCCARIKRRFFSFETIFLVFFIIVFSFLSGFRSFDIGNDTQNYIYYFSKFKDGNLDLGYRIEIGYQLFNFFIGRFTSDPHAFLFIYSSLCYIFVGIIIYKESYNIPLSVCFLFFVFFSLFIGLLRQGLSTVLILYAYVFIKRKRNIKAFVLICVAGIIHYSAFLFLLFFLYKRIRVNLSYFISVIALVGLLSALGVIEKAVSVAFPQYAYYFDSKYSAGGYKAVFLYLIIGFALWFLSYLSYKKAPNSITKLSVFNFSLYVLFCVLGFSMNLFTRAADYCLAIAMIEVPYLVSLFKRKKTITVVVACTLLLYFFVILIFRPEWNNIYPYRFYWS